MTENERVVIIGAGPYALSTAAFLRRAGVEPRVFGEVMGFWNAMPRGMYLRSARKASSIADPERVLRLDGYEASIGRKLTVPTTLEDFIEYGRWFRDQIGVEVDSRRVTRVANGTGFRVTTDDGEEVQAAHVVVAVGIEPFSWRPEMFAGFDSSLVSHTSEHRSYDALAGKSVLVVGAGQSALEAAVFLKELGSSVEVIVRRSALRFLRGEGVSQSEGLMSKLLYPEWAVGPPVVNLLMGQPSIYRVLPKTMAEPLAYRAIRPAGSARLEELLEGIAITTSRHPTGARSAGSQMAVELDDGSERVVDHVILATGYRIDLSRYAFLDPELRSKIRLQGSSPKLASSFSSSVPRLYFVGAPAAASLGPGMRFVSHTGFAAKAITSNVLRD